MRPGRHLGALAAVALQVSWLLPGCANAPPPGPQLEARLWKRARPPVEVASGDSVRAGDELYMTLITRRALYVYIVSEDAAGTQEIVYPCRGWDRSRPFAARRPQRLPPPLLGRDAFWPVRSATTHEDLTLVASGRPAQALEDAMLVATSAPPCAAPLGGAASRWLHQLSVFQLASAGDARRPPAGAWKNWTTGEDGWFVRFQLLGVTGHG